MGVAHAQSQPATETSITAEALFEAGRADMQRADYAAACPKFAESQRLDPAAGTLINLADCEERLGLLAHAWQLWREAVERLPADDARRPAVADRATSVDRRVPRLTLKLARGVPSSASVVRDDVPIGSGLFDVPLPLDPGQHIIVLMVIGYLPARYVVTLRESARETVVLDLGPIDPNMRPPAPGPADVRPEPNASDGASYIGWGLLGVGAIGIGTGITTGLLAIGKRNEQDRNCYPAKVCTPAGADAAESGSTFATVSTLSFVVGGAAALTGLYLVLRNRGQRATSPASSITPMFFPGGMGLGMARSL